MGVSRGGRSRTLIAGASICVLIFSLCGACSIRPPSTDGPPETTIPARAAFPDPSSTGSSDGPGRSTRGATEISTAGAVIENVDFTGRVTVRADHVTLRNISIRTDDWWVLMNYGRNTVVENSTLVGGARSEAMVADFDSGNFAGRALDLSGGIDGVKMGSGSSLEASLIHDLSNRQDVHNDGVEVTGATDVVITGNTILNSSPQTSCVMLASWQGRAPHNVTVSSNLLAGGGWTIYGGDPATGVRIVDNHFSTRFFAGAGRWGWVSYLAPAGNEWSDNRWDDGPNAGQLLTR